MNKSVGLIIGGLFLLLALVSFEAKDKVSDFTNQIIHRFNKIWTGAPQEKAYLQTDKPYYNAGEDLWFKGYLVNATTHMPTALSRFLYVELIDDADSVISRFKVRKDSLGFSGFVKLNPKLSSGFYTLRAFTYWMQNATADYFFRKNIYIGNSLADGVTCQIIYGTQEKGNIPVNLVFANSSQSPMNGKTVLVKQNGSKNFKKKQSYTINLEGKVNFQLSIDSTDHAKKWLEVTMDQGALKYNKKFYIPDFSNDFDVQFFPESGVLVDDNMQVVAFKAIGTDGLSVDVTGKVFTGTNLLVADFSSLNKGMGKFILQPKKDERYYAVVKKGDGLEKRFELPPVQTEGVALRLINFNGRIVYEVINHSDRPNNSLYMLIHSRGKVFAIYPVNQLGGKIPETILPAGITSFSIIDTLGNTLCERLVFDWSLHPTKIKMNADKSAYGKREAVNLDFFVGSEEGKPLDGKFSVSVTDSRTVMKDTLADNIVSYLLMSSDIKGHIEDPAAYFANNSVSTREKMDILMLTQGWRRFNTSDVVKGQMAKPTYYLELGQGLSGNVTNILGKPPKKCDVIALTSYNNSIRITQTDSLGRFLFDGIEFPDSTSFILKADSKKSLMDVEITPDLDDFLKSSNILPIPRDIRIPAPLEYFQQSKDKYYFEGGMKGVNLDEITVVAEKKKSSSANQYYSGMADVNVTSKDLEKYSGMNIKTLLTMMSGVQVMGDQISIRGGGTPLFLVDGFSTDRFEEISYLTASDINEISLFKGASAAIFGSRGGNGAIAITLKYGVDRTSRTPTQSSLAHIVPLGYQKPAQFYVPKYEVDSVRLGTTPDLRTTIYWNPALSSDSTGIVHVKFFTADKANDYSVVLEGITNSGEICRYVGILKREDK
jgi:hypothetical protein